MPAGEARQSADGGGLDAAQPPEHDAQDPFADAGSLAHAHGAAEQAIPAHEVDAAAASAAKQRKLANKLAQKRVRDRQKEKLLIAETKVVELTSRLQQLRIQQKVVQGQEADAEPPQLDEQTRSFLVDRLHLAQELVLTVDQAAPPLTMTAQQLLDLPLERTRELWRMYMSAFAEQLQLWAGDSQSPAALRLSRVYWEAAQVWMTLHNCPRLFQGTSQFSSRLGSRHVALQEDLTPGEHHQRLLAAARLSAEQKSVLCALRVPLYTNFGRLQAQRAAAIVRLQALVPSAAEQLLEHGRAPSGDAPQTADAASVISDLKAILQEEQCQYSLAISIMWTRVLTCFQGALMKVLAWPSNVGMFGISELVAREAGEPTVQELLRRGTLDVDGHLLPLEAEVPPTMPVQRMPPPDAGLATGLPHGIGMASPGA